MTKVKCLICGKEFDWLPPHLRIHNITTKEYYNRFPDAKIMEDNLSRTGENNPAYGKPAWNKGLTKETDKRVKKYSGSRPGSRPDLKGKQTGKTFEEIWGIEKATEMKKNISKIKKAKYVSGETISERKGKTKENDAGCKRTSEKLSKLKKGNSKYAIIALRNRGKGSLRPNKLETEMMNILNSTLPNEYKYCGNGKVVIEGMIPDFININGYKKVIEVNGSYWHDKSDEETRIANFKKYGYDCLVVWDYEMTNKNNVINKVLNFHNLPSLPCNKQLTLDEIKVGGGNIARI